MTPSPLHSVRSKLIALSLGLIVVPGVVFALLASSNATAALERAVGRQLATIARQGALELAAVVDEQRARLLSWSAQEQMREVLVGDVDKRISRFLVGQRARAPMLLDVIATDTSGTAVAATDPTILGAVPASDLVHAVTRDEHGEVAVAGPHVSTRYQREVLELAAPINDPEDASSRIGVLNAIYDWRVTAAALEKVREDVASMGIAVEILVLDGDGRIIGGSWTSRPSLDRGDDLRLAGWSSAQPDSPSYGVEPRADALVGRAALAPPAPPWSVLRLCSPGRPHWHQSGR